MSVYESIELDAIKYLVTLIDDPLKTQSLVFSKITGELVVVPIDLTTLDAIQAGTANGVQALALIKPSSFEPSVNGVLVKNPGGGWGQTGMYGEGQVFEYLGDGNAGASTIHGVSAVITAVTNTTPIQVTATSHGASTGDVLRVSGTGIASIDNKWWKVTRVDPNVVSLDGSVASGAASLTASSHLYGDCNPTMFRISPDASIGMAGALHLAAGLRGVAGFPFTPGISGYSMFIDPSFDIVGMLIENPTTGKWKPTPVSPFIEIVDTRGASGLRALWQVEADGTTTVRRQEGKADVASVFRVRNNADNADVLALRADGGASFLGPNVGIGIAATATLTLTVIPTNDADNILFLARRALTTGNMLTLVDSNLVTVLSRFDKNGYFMTRKHAAPDDGDLVSGELSIWFDQTNGAAKAMFKGKQADGTICAASVALA